MASSQRATSIHFQYLLTLSRAQQHRLDLLDPYSAASQFAGVFSLNVIGSCTGRPAVFDWAV